MFPTVLPFDEWSNPMREEFNRNQQNGVVGSVLVSESDRVRVWHIRLRPGERMPFHRHNVDYFWTALTEGKSRSHQQDGSIVEATYKAGTTQHYSFRKGEFKIHDLENIGDTELVFTTVEFLNSSNAPLDVPDSVRLNLPSRKN